LKVNLDDLEGLENKTEDEIIGHRTLMEPFSLFADYFNQIDKKPKKGYPHIVIQLNLTTGKCLPTFYLSNKKFAVTKYRFGLISFFHVKAGPSQQGVPQGTVSK
jgi:hypothetical protein